MGRGAGDHRPFPASVRWERLGSTRRRCPDAPEPHLVVTIAVGAPPARPRDALLPPPVSPPARLRHRPALDAVRGLAVLIVVAFHSELGIARGGYLGVSTFFTLSGFLITTLVLVEHSGSGRFDLRGFWRRRFRRLLPRPSWPSCWWWRSSPSSATSSTSGRSAGTPSRRCSTSPTGTCSGAAPPTPSSSVSPSPLVHMWSLAVEEQFYVAFPLVVALLIGRRHRRGTAPRLSLRGRLGVSAGVAIVVSTAEPALFHFGIDRTYYGTDTRAAEIAVGILLAVLLFPAVAGAEADRPLGAAAGGG